MTQRTQQNRSPNPSTDAASKPPAKRVNSAVERRQYPIDLAQSAVVFSHDGKRMQVVKTPITLSIAQKTLVAVSGVGNLVTVPGYRVQASTAGVNVVNAPMVTGLDGAPVTNPYPIRDRETGRLQAILCRAFAFGYTSTGVPVVNDQTVYFDLATYEAVDIVGKLKAADASQWIVLAADDEDAPPSWISKPIGDGMAVHLKRSDHRTVKLLGEVLNRRRKAMEFATTFAQRRAMAHHPAIMVHQSPEASVTFWGFRWIGDGAAALAAWDRSRYEIMQRTIAGIVDGTVGSDELGTDRPVERVVEAVDAREMAEDPASAEADPSTIDEHDGGADDAPPQSESAQVRESMEADLAVLAHDDPALVRRAIDQVKAGVKKWTDLDDNQLARAHRLAQAMHETETTKSKEKNDA